MRSVGTEGIFQCHSDYNEYQNVQLVKLSGKISKNFFKKAVEMLLEKYELLQQGVVFQNFQKYYNGVPDYQRLFFETNYHEIPREDDKTCEEIFKIELANGSRDFIKMAHKINEKQTELLYSCGLMWKIFLICEESNDDFEVIISIDHTISDGLTICILIGDLFNLYRKLQSDELIDQKIIKMCPKLTEVFKDKKVIKQPDFSGKVCGFMFDIKENKYKKLKQEVNFVEFDGEKLIQLSKKKNFTINSIVSAAVFLSYSKHFCKEEFGKFMKMMIPISIRNQANFGQNSIGMLAAFLNIQLEYKKENISEEYFWDIVQIIQNDVKQSIEE